MAFDLPVVTARKIPTGPARPGGLLDIVEWDNGELASRSTAAPKFKPTNVESTMLAYTIDATKTPVSSPAYQDAYIYTGYLRRHFGIGEVVSQVESAPGANDAVSAFELAKRITQDNFDVIAEAQLVRAMLAAVTVTDITPGSVPSFKIALAMLERAGAKLSSGYSPVILLPTTAAPYLGDLNLGDNVTPAGYTPGGSRVAVSPGAVPGGQLSALSTVVSQIKGYVMGQPFGSKETLVTTKEIGDDADLTTNDFWVTVEATWVIGFNGTAIYACSGTA